MYFNFLPSIKYDVKPISYPFSESDYVVAKNFFRRYNINETAFSQSVYFNKYALQDGQRLDQIAEAVYGRATYDWIIVLTNNMVNTTFDLPMSEAELRRHVEGQYDDPYYGIHHYEIKSEEEQVAAFGKVLMPPGTWVDEEFFNGTETKVADTFPDLSSEQKFVTYENNYVFSSTGFDNSFVVDSQNATFQTYGTGQGEDGGFVLYAPLRNGVRSNGYLRFRGVGERFAEFYQLDATHLDNFVFKGKFGNDINGGEEAELANEILKLQYRTNDTDPWEDIDVIIPLGMVQYFEFDGTPQAELGFGGPGRPEGLYENVPLYTGQGEAENITGARVDVTVDATGRVTAVDIVDRGRDLPSTTNELWIRNEDIGNGFYYNGPEQREDQKEYLLDFFLFTASTRETPSGVQFGQFSDVPYEFIIPVPEAAKTETTRFRLFQPENSGEIFDQYAVQELQYQFSQTYTVGTSIDYVEIDPDNFVVDGVRWTRQNGTWYRVTRNGFRYNNNGVTETATGSDLARPVTIFEYESYENEKKREIYILKPTYVRRLVDDFRKASLYKKSSDYVSNRLKQTGV